MKKRKKRIEIEMECLWICATKKGSEKEGQLFSSSGDTDGLGVGSAAGRALTSDASWDTGAASYRDVQVT